MERILRLLRMCLKVNKYCFASGSAMLSLVFISALNFDRTIYFTRSLSFHWKEHLIYLRLPSRSQIMVAKRKCRNSLYKSSLRVLNNRKVCFKSIINLLRIGTSLSGQPNSLIKHRKYLLVKVMSWLSIQEHLIWVIKPLRMYKVD